jgi:hypothetical protein
MATTKVSRSRWLAASTSWGALAALALARGVGFVEAAAPPDRCGAADGGDEYLSGLRFSAREPDIVRTPAARAPSLRAGKLDARLALRLHGTRAIDREPTDRGPAALIALPRQGDGLAIGRGRGVRTAHVVIVARARDEQTQQRSADECCIRLRIVPASRPKHCRLRLHAYKLPARPRSEESRSGPPTPRIRVRFIRAPSPVTRTFRARCDVIRQCAPASRTKVSR